ncbi:MAG: lysine--tRNA ligase, partial [Thermoleophilia bacterium]|nr:lysine--tRNA ligase [Thermoleophilia bacterium]
VSLDTPLEDLRQYCQRFEIEEPQDASAGMLLEELYVELVESKTTTPVFYQDFPKENAPLTRVHRDDPRLTEKWDLVGWGAEMGTGYSELIDPIDQRERFMEQGARAARGDAEAMRLDEDFLRALEHGMPPAGGQGMGIDRLVMTLTGLGVRDTILFPLVKPE